METYFQGEHFSRLLSEFPTSKVKVLPRVELGSLDSKSRVLDHYTTEPGQLSESTFVTRQVIPYKQKVVQGTLGFEPGTSRSAVECSTTELYPLS